MFQIFFREVNSFLNSLIGYLVIGMFLICIGLLTWVFPSSSVLEYGYANMDTLFSLGPYILIFLLSAVTMRSFAEEKRLRTLEWLMTKPLTDWDLIFGKFLASNLLAIFSLAFTIVYYFSLYYLGDPVGNIDSPGVLGSYVGMVLLSAVFCAIGILASSLSNNQIVSFLFSIFFCTTFYIGFDFLAQLFENGSIVILIRQWGILYHYESLSRGLIDSRDIVYFLTLIGVFLLFSKVALNKRTW